MLVLPSLFHLFHEDQCVHVILFLIPTQFSHLPLCMNMKESPIFECYQLFSSFVAIASIS